MEKLKVLDLFSGIGGFSLGLERTGGFVTTAFCEIEPFPRKVLAKHWPDVPCFHDVRELTANDVGPIDVITGGFPCQDISLAGKQAGLGTETRSGLWSEIVRLTGELQPQFVIVENVANLLAGPSDRPGGWFGRILGDLAEIGYDAEWHCIPASELGAHHHRDRVWVIAYARGFQHEGCGHAIWRKGAEEFHEANMANTPGIGQSGPAQPFQSVCKAPIIDRETINVIASGIGSIWAIEPELGRVADGIPDRSHRLKGLGNAVIPQIPELIGRAILDAINPQPDGNPK